MKRQFYLFTLFSLFSVQVYPIGLLDVYHDALQNDQIFKQAESTFSANKELLPRARAALLPTITVTGKGSENWNQVNNSGIYFAQGGVSTNNTQYLSTGYTLQATQPLMNWSAFAGYRVAKASVNQAAAVFTAAQQDLILRVAQTYFDVLQAEEILRYAESEKNALDSQLGVARQRYKVGLDPITSVYQAQASYDASVASYFSKQNDLSNEKEKLRVITNKFYPEFNKLGYSFPLVFPNPVNIDIWTRAAIEKNLNLKAARYSMLAAQDDIKAQEGNHLPTLNLEGAYGTTQNKMQSGVSGTQDNTLGTVQLNLNFNAYTGGAISSQVRQAEAQYQGATARMEEIYRNTVADTRKFYFSVMTGISQVKADRQAVKSSLAALKSTQASYKVGMQTMNDVLQQQELLYQAQTTYTQDRFNYLKMTLNLKEVTGSLSIRDLVAIDAWLSANKKNVLVSLTSNLQPVDKQSKQLEKKLLADNDF